MVRETTKRIELTCIICPNGCPLIVEHTEGQVLRVDNAACNRGKEYATEEIVNPVRTLTTTVKVLGGEIPLTSVRTDRPIPKSRMFDGVQELRGLQVKAPVEAGTVLVRDFLGTGANIVVTKTVPAASG